MAGLLLIHLTVKEQAGMAFVSANEIETIQEEEMPEIIKEILSEQETEAEEIERVDEEEPYMEETSATAIEAEEIIVEASEMDEEQLNVSTQKEDDLSIEMSKIVTEQEITEEFSDMQEFLEDENLALQEEEYLVEFDLYVEEDISSVKAGQSIGYELYLENTGDINLKNLVIRAILDNGNLEGRWLETDDLSIDYESETVILSSLEAGETRKLVFMLDTEEDCKEEISAEFLARVVNPLNEEEILSQSLGLTTEVIPLTIDFKVTKWADRNMALPGETILYQICIRNTGERTLHSVLTTEKFVNAGVQARFQDKEGVILNGSKTQALISEIKPGEAFGLNALVTIPEDMESGELLNEVIVITAETGEQKVTAQAAVEILESAEIETLEEITETENMEVIAQVPKTEDVSETEFWAGIFGISWLSIIGSYWLQKTKRKH